MTKRLRKKLQFVYQKIVDDISNQILKGTLKVGDKLPTVRQLSKNLGVSINTVLNSYLRLENLGLVEAKPQSGYYVRNRAEKILPEVEILTLETAIKTYKSDELVSNVHELAQIPEMVSLGPGVPSVDMLPAKKINRIVSSIMRGSETAGLLYEFPPGYYKLRREVAKRAIIWGGKVSPDDVIITGGATEAIVLALKAVAKPGDTIVTESPTFYLLLQLIKDLGMNILEIPTHPRDGIEISALKKVLKSHSVSACVIYPTVNNPLGSIMPEERKKELYELLVNKDIPLIEGDVWGELHFEHHRPKPIKSLDDKGIVLYFSSVTKTGLPGYRIGWICPGRYYKKVKDIQYMYSVATSALPQIAVSEFMKSGGYEKSIKNLRNVYSSRLSVLSQYVSEFFPEGTKISRPKGGAFLWVEMPKSVDSIKLQELAFRKNISINPGPLFSTTENFSNYIRLSAACLWSPRIIEDAIRTLGDICKSLM